MEGDIGGVHFLGGHLMGTLEEYIFRGAFDGDIEEAYWRGTLKGDSEMDIGRVHLRGGALDHWKGTLEGDIGGFVFKHICKRRGFYN